MPDYQIVQIDQRGTTGWRNEPVYVIHEKEAGQWGTVVPSPIVRGVGRPGQGSYQILDRRRCIRILKSTTRELYDLVLGGGPNPIEKRPLWSEVVRDERGALTELKLLGVAWDERIRVQDGVQTLVGATWSKPEAARTGVLAQSFEDGDAATAFCRMMDAGLVPNVTTPGGDDSLVVWREILQRRGQLAMRTLLLAAFQGQCCISKCDATAVLEAAHVIPHAVGGEMTVENGLLLRADLHTLFDGGLLRINPESLKIELHSRVLASRPYASLLGEPVRKPVSGDIVRWKAALSWRYAWARESPR